MADNDSVTAAQPAILKAPFPWFGGKSRVASLVWDRFGNVPNYVEPFAGSLAVLLGRPHTPRNETVNDKDAYLANFWRALAHDPEALAHWADWPVNETDLHARHRWLVDQSRFRERTLTDPEFYDPKIAGWWVWGISMWIGSGWCSRPEWTGRTHASRARGINGQLNDLVRPHLNRGAQGIEALSRAPEQKRPILKRSGIGVHRQMPDVSGAGNSSGRGVLAPSKAGTALLGYMEALAGRLRRVRVCCGDWTRVLGPSPTTNIGVTAVFLDPPYDMRVVQDKAWSDGAAPTDTLYNEHDNDLSRKVATWAIEHGDDRDLRIALCGYEGEYAMPDSWECVMWKSHGGYANQANAGGDEHRTRERIWFSPHCLKQPALFDTLFS